MPNMGYVRRPYGSQPKTSHRTDRCGKVAMVRICNDCGAVVWGPTCDGCGGNATGNGAADVRQGSIRHLRAILAQLRADDSISEDAVGRIMAAMLGCD